jgi:hypothetical protein
MRVSVKLCLTEASGLAAAVEKDDGEGIHSEKTNMQFRSWCWFHVQGPPKQ